MDAQQHKSNDDWSKNQSNLNNRLSSLSSKMAQGNGPSEGQESQSKEMSRFSKQASMQVFPRARDSLMTMSRYQEKQKRLLSPTLSKVQKRLIQFDSKYDSQQVPIQYYKRKHGSGAKCELNSKKPLPQYWYESRILSQASNQDQRSSQTIF